MKTSEMIKMKQEMAAIKRQLGKAGTERIQNNKYYHWGTEYSRDLNGELVWYSSGPKKFAPLMVSYSGHG